jgi:hypothetical protein
VSERRDTILSVASLTADEVLRWRLHALRLAGTGLSSPEAVVEHLLCVQGEQMGPTAWALATRCGASQGSVSAALESDVLRTHLLRSTWHLVRPADIGWVLELCRARLLPLWTRQLDGLGVPEKDRRAGTVVIEKALTPGAGTGPRHLTRAELGEALATAGLPVTGMALGGLLGHAETTGLICSGVPRGPKGEHTYALLEERAPDRRRLDRDQALAEVASRYVRGHGPVTERDLSYWASLTLADVRAGFAASAEGDPSIHQVEVDGTSYWVRGEPVLGPLEPRAHLLHILDEAYRGYQDSRAVIDREGLLAEGRESALGMLLVEGQILGSTRRVARAQQVDLEIHLFRSLRDEEEAAVGEAAERYGAWLGRDPVLRFTTR